jgi:hypothetical protein
MLYSMKLSAEEKRTVDGEAGEIKASIGNMKSL